MKQLNKPNEQFEINEAHKPNSVAGTGGQGEGGDAQARGVQLRDRIHRSQANMAQVGQLRPDPGFGFEVKVISKKRSFLLKRTVNRTPKTVAGTGGQGQGGDAQARGVQLRDHIHRSQANMAQVGQLRPDPGFGFEVKVIF